MNPDAPQRKKFESLSLSEEITTALTAEID
jgi:hypothetical protein